MSGPPGSQALEYGFELTEEQMYTKLFLKQVSKDSSKNDHANEQRNRDQSKPYASFDCAECVQMASLMLEEELRFYMQRNNGKRQKGKSRDALFRGFGNSTQKVPAGGQPYKGAGSL